MSVRSGVGLGIASGELVVEALGELHGEVVPEDVKEKVMARRQEIIDGAHVFEGPIRDQSGYEVIAAGQVPSDGDLWGMNYLVEGVIGDL